MPSPCPILVLFAHPALHKSRVNLVLVQAIRDLPRVTVHDLYEVYPLFDSDVRREQALRRRMWTRPGTQPLCKRRQPHRRENNHELDRVC